MLEDLSLFRWQPVVKSIFDYLDYRSYLKDYYEERKRLHKYFSYRYFGNKVGIDPSCLLKIILKTRHIAEKSIPQMSAFLGFNDTEAEYFLTLVHFVKAKSHSESKIYFEKLFTIKNIKSCHLIEQQYEYFRTWYHPVIRSVLEYFDFKDDYALLGKQLSPAISAREARASVRLLEDLNLIHRGIDGRYLLTEKAVTTGDEWKSIAISAFQEQTIRLSHEALVRHDRSLRDISTVTMNINAADFHEIRKRITEFRRSIIAFVGGRSGPDRTYQLNIQFFPLTDINEGSK